MPRLPDLDSLGSRPVPQSRRSIASNPRAGAVAEAFGGLGEQLAGAGQRMVEKQDRLAYAAAKTAILKADIAARQELETDPDYENWSTKYAERMRTAREAAGGLIRSRSDRSLFEAEAEIDVARGNSALSTAANARRRDSRVALGMDALAELSDVGQDAPDDATREATILNAHDLIQGMVEAGDVDAVRAGELRRDWTQRYVIQRVETLRGAGDLESAQAFFEANRGRLEPDAEIRLGSQISDALENRENLVIAEEIVHGGGAPPLPGAAPQQMQVVGRAAPVAAVLQRAGYAAPVVAGFLGNFEVEGGYGGARGDGGSASGIAQWRNERRANFKRKFGKEPHEATAAEQAQFVVWEMQNPRDAGMTVAQRDAILAARTPEEAAALIDQHYERSSGEHRSRRQEAARNYHGGTVNEAAGQHDLESIYNAINDRAEAEGWTPERTEAVKAQAGKLVERDEALLGRERDEAYESALATVEALGDDFTNVSQLGDAYYRMSPADKIRVQSIAAENAKPEETAANGDVIRSLHRMAIEAPGQFASIDLRPYRAFMTPGEFDEVSTSQARVKSEAGEWSPRTQIQNTISWGKNFGGVDVPDGEDKYRVYRYMEDRARQFRGEANGRQPAESDYQRWFREATAEVPVTRSFAGIDALLPDTSRRSFETLSPNYRKMIRRQFKAQFGREPNEQEVQEWFERMGEELR